MSRKLKLILISVPTVVILFFIGIYILLSVYYKDSFSYGTWINGVYCTGKNIDEVNFELKTKYELNQLEINYPDGSIEYIEPGDINYSIDFTDYLKDIKDSQESFLWIKNLFGTQTSENVKPVCTYDSDLLLNEISNLTCVRENIFTEPSTVKIIKTENGFELFDSHYPNIDLDKFVQEINDSLVSDMSVSFTNEYLFVDDYSDDEQIILKEWENIQDYFDTSVTIDFGAEIPVLDHSTLSRFITLTDKGLFLRDDNGKPIINEHEVSDFSDEICGMYDTYVSPRSFVSHTGEVKTIDTVLYGTLIDHDALKKDLYEAITKGTDTTITPVYLKEGYVKGLNDIGPTYIEIDLGIQKLFYYKYGEQMLETDIVSGKPSTMTPAMVTQIFSKSRNVTLRGTNYASFVNYWVPIYPKMGIGLHDASWQSKYGGDRYLTNGSHGCINMQKDAIAYLYEEIEIGLPVIVYY